MEITGLSRIVFIALATLPSVAAGATAQDAASPSFDVVSVRRNTSGDGGMSFQILPGGRFVAVNATVRALLQAAYQFEYLPFQLVGGPDWIDAEHFDIEGRSSPSASITQISEMVRSLLAQRFKLVFAKEMREMRASALLKTGSVAGPQLRQPASVCDRRPVPVDAPPPVPGPSTTPRCGVRFVRGSSGQQRIEGTGATMAELSRTLSQITRRPVLDRTGLNGTFDLHFEFTPDNDRPAGDAADAGTALFTALRDDLGLGLEATTGTVEVLAIRSAERPSEN